MPQQVPHLVILPTIKAMVNPETPDTVVLTGKFLSGMKSYAQQWPGPVTLLIEANEGRDTNLDHESVKIADLPYTLKLVNYDDPALVDQLAVGDVVLASVCWRQNHISLLCQKVKVPCVYVSEYALQTRLQMEKARSGNPLIYIRRALWHWQHERKHRRALRLADGLQANGTPTYKDYLGLAKHAMLYFDSRVSRNQMASQEDVEHRYQYLFSVQPLRLAFSGRLMSIKGTDHLPVIARALRQMQIPFTMEICGDGELFEAMKQKIREWHLDDVVFMRGVLDFHKQLIPMMKQNVDLFICTHRQGDPSCTYLETMSCGVPIVGYGNAAFTGLCEHAGAGWVTPMNKPEKLAKQIATLHMNRREIMDHATQSLAFARNHSFEDTFTRRVDQLIQLSRKTWEVTSPQTEKIENSWISQGKELVR